MHDFWAHTEEREGLDVPRTERHVQLFKWGHIRTYA